MAEEEVQAPHDRIGARTSRAHAEGSACELEQCADPLLEGDELGRC